jgi:transposase InsO family protein
VSMAGFIVTQRVEYQVPHATSCRALGVSQAWFYKWRHGDPSVRHARREQLRIEIARLFAAHKSRYGSPRITADLRDLGWSISVNTVAQIMSELGLRARRPRRRRQTTRPVGVGGGLRTWSEGTSPRRGSIKSGSATAPRSLPTRASCTSTASWISGPAE